jgi:mRNA interferase MazF
MQSKKRPARVVSATAYNVAKPDVVVTAVTSQPRVGAALGEVIVRHRVEAGLLKPSLIKPVFATLEQTMILRAIETLEPFDRGNLAQAIAECLGGIVAL